MSISLLRQLLMKEAVKKSAGASGIMTINKNITKEVDQLLQKYINDAMQQGVDIETLSPDQLKMIVAMNSKATNRVISGSSPEGRAITEKLFGKKGEVVQFPQKRTFKEEIEAMKKSGDLVDEDNMVISEKITDREMFKDANKRFKTKETETDIAARINKENKESAQRIKNKKMVNDAIDNASPGFAAGDRKYNAQLVAEDLAEKRFGKEFYDLDQKEQIKIYDEAYQGLYEKQVFDTPEYDPKGRAQFEKDVEEAGGMEEFLNKNPIDDDSGDFAQGGRAEYYTGGMIDVEPNLSDIGHGSDSLMARTRLVSPDGQATTSTGLNYLLAEDNDNIRVPFGDGKNFEMYLREREQIERQRRLEQLMKEYQDDINRKKVMEQKQMAAEGGRIGFSAGGGGRRAFLKLMAALTGGAAAFKTGILGLTEGAGKKAVTETVKKAGAASEVPPYFFKLVDKIKTLGDETMASQDKAIAKKYKDYVMEEDFAGNISIIKKNMDDPYPEEVIMSYRVDEVTLPGRKGSAKVDEYEEFTVRPDRDGKMKDVEPGVPDEVVNEGSVFEDNMTDFGMTKKADGGRIGFSPGGLANVLARLGIKGSSQRFLEKVFGKEGFKEMTKNDPDMYRGLLEVVEMFRNRDKEGLKLYMKNFLPHMDDAEIEKFIVGSTPDIEGLSGQLTRLGSGRDYKGKLEMMKKADEVKKLQEFDIKNVTKNAEGGRIGFSGGGIFRAIIAKAAAAKGMKPYEFIKVTSYKSLPREVKMFMSADDFAKLKSGQEQMYNNYIDMMKTRKNFQQEVEGGKKTAAKPLFESMEKMMDEQSYVPKTVTADDIAEAELMVKNRFQKGRKDNALGGLQTMLGE